MEGNEQDLKGGSSNRTDSINCAPADLRPVPFIRQGPGAIDSILLHLLQPRIHLAARVFTTPDSKHLTYVLQDASPRRFWGDL